MRGFSRQERGELFHSFSFPGPDFPSHLDFPSPLVPPSPPTPPMGLTLVVSITRVLPPSWILKPKYDWERKRSVRNQRGGLSAKTRRGDMGVMGGEENFLAFLSRFLECPELFAICNIHHSYVKCAKSRRISALSN